MGYMVDGVYHVGDDVTKTLPDGQWERSRSTVRHWIGEGEFTADASRYHLFVAWNCPWAHRTLLTRAIMGLEDITVSYAKPNRTDQGWVYDQDGEFSDPLLGVRAVHEVYSADPMRYTGRLTVPVLWDKHTNRMVSNESADIVRMLGQSFDGPDLYPRAHQTEIDDWNALIYDTVNNGVYRAGFASTQEAYQKAAYQVFETLDKIDAHLAKHDWLAGEALTEADIRLFPTLARFDVAYHYAFRCNLKKLSDYPNLWPYAKRIYRLPGVADTVRFEIYKRGYFSASEKRNPLGIIPIGPTVNWD
ncbi:glutathione S-transferase family protein [Yoonia litorea]|uniref:Putative glutathione S-transferase n=1 Tax=Yoonia litorea TaxID=1123755 RepID=A0A1I6MX75_9RHOB|nr:glutathione S-transferase C-terminal domain-containing protein [Yoonia litorea]SFS20221.1 putative glutathione S-transferase [Yoonia litorea]